MTSTLITYREYSRRVVLTLFDKVVEPVMSRVLSARTMNLIQCHRRDMWNPYFREAEGSFAIQWETVVWPLIRDFDFTHVLELSPGAGRNTQMLCTLARRLTAVDYNEYALKQTRERLGQVYSGCELQYHRNNGYDLSMVPDASVTAVYCWDAAVHFDREIVTAYIKEFGRVLEPGGCGFFHHSDLGDGADKNIKRNPGWRSNVSKELVADACRQSGLVVKVQAPIPLPVPGHPIVDCATVFCKDRPV